MSIRIIGGFAKGFTLQVSNQSVRPTSVILRRKIFDRYQDLSGYCFVDLFAGTGAMGFEAISRGANKALLIERNPKVFQILKKNSQNFTEKFSASSIEILCQRAIDFLNQYRISEGEYIFFVDPPYKNNQDYLNAVSWILANMTSGMLWLEIDQQQNFSREQIQEIITGQLSWYEHGSRAIVVKNFP